MKRIDTIAGILCLLVLNFTGETSAQDIDLEKIVVTPSRMEESYGDVSRKVNVITAQDIERSGAKDLTQVLTGITSVNISDYGGMGGSKNIRMRGSTAAQVLVLVDGRPINNPRDGEVDFSTVPLDNVERIEVMHGPGSSLYGAGAMGGTVNIITKKPPKEKPETELSTSFGSFRTYIERFSHGARISRLGYLITGGYETSEGFRDNMHSYAKDFNAKFEYELNSENNLSLNSGFYRSKTGSPGKTTDFDIDDKQANLKNFLELNWSFQPDESLGLSTKIYQNYDRLEFMENTVNSVFDSEPPLDKKIHTTKVKGLDVQFNKQLAENYRVICGFNYVANLNDSTATAKHKYTLRAGYLEGQLDLWKDFTANLGCRIDDYSNFGTEVNPNFSFLYRFNTKIKFHGVLSRSFRVPTFNDLYYPDVGWAKGNLDLKPEKGITGELGADIRINKYFGSGLTYYRSNYKQLIQWSDNGSGLWQPENVSSAIIDGIEFENKIYLSDNLEWDIDYTFLRAIDDKAHKYLIYQPKHKIDSSLKYKDHNGLAGELRGQFTDKRYHTIDDPFYSTIKVKRFFILGLNISKKFKPGVTCFASIDNLLNRKYQVIRDYPMPGTSFNGGLKLEF